MAVGCSFTDISGLACYNYLLVVTVFSAPPFPMELQRQERKSERKGRDASEQLQPFHTPATKSATTTVDMMRKDEGEEDEEKDDDDNNNNNNNVWLHGRGKPMSVPASSHLRSTSSPLPSVNVHDHQSRSNTGSQVKHLPLPIVARHSGSSRLGGSSYRLVLSTVPGRWRNVAERTGVPLRASCSHSHQGLQTGYPLT